MLLQPPKEKASKDCKKILLQQKRAAAGRRDSEPLQRRWAKLLQMVPEERQSWQRRWRRASRRRRWSTNEDRTGTFSGLRRGNRRLAPTIRGRPEIDASIWCVCFGTRS